MLFRNFKCLVNFKFFGSIAKEKLYVIKFKWNCRSYLKIAKFFIFLSSLLSNAIYKTCSITLKNETKIDSENANKSKQQTDFCINVENANKIYSVENHCGI